MTSAHGLPYGRPPPMSVPRERDLERARGRERQRERGRERERESGTDSERKRERERERERGREIKTEIRFERARVDFGGELTLSKSMSLETCEYRGTSPTRNCHSLGPYSRPMLRSLRCSQGGGRGAGGLRVYNS